jgi:hypothetical protein
VERAVGANAFIAPAWPRALSDPVKASTDCIPAKAGEDDVTATTAKMSDEEAVRIAAGKQIPFEL